MPVYAGSLAFSLLITFLVHNKKALNSYVRGYYFRTYKAAFLAMLPLIIVAISRWNVGVDSVYQGTYWIAYKYSKYNINILGFEPLFFLLQRFCSTLQISYWGFLSIHSMIFMTCSVYAIKRGSISVFSSVFLFFSLFIYFDSYTSLRQSISEAICMVMLSIMLTDDDGIKKDVLSIILILIASGFHSISLLYIPIYFFCKRKFSAQGIIVTTVVAIAAYPVLQRVFILIMRHFFSAKYSFIGVSQYNLLLSTVVLLVCIIFYNDLCSVGNNGYKVVNISLSIFIIMLNSGALLLPYRCFDMLKISYIFIIPMIVKRIKSGRMRFIVSTGFAVIFGYWFINALFIQTNSFIEYKSIFDDLSVIYLE